MRRAVDLRANGRITDGALEEWANLLLLSDSYEPAPHLDESERETLLQRLHELASPSLFGG